MRSESRRKTASLVSNLFNPFLLSILIIVLASIETSATNREAIKWVLLSLAMTTLPIFAIILYLVRSERLDDFFINVRRQRHKIYALSGFCTALACAVLYYLGAPMLLVAVFLSGLLSVVIFMSINLVWKISVHTAFAAAVVTILVFLYGPPALAAAFLLPVVGWSRIELEHHSPTQVATGAAIAAVVVLAVFTATAVT